MNIDLLNQLTTFLANKTPDEVQSIIRSIETKTNELRSQKLLEETPEETNTGETTTGKTPEVDTTPQVDGITQEAPTGEKTKVVAPAKAEAPTGDSIAEEVKKQLAPTIEKLEKFMGQKKPDAPKDKKEASDEDIKTAYAENGK